MMFYRLNLSNCLLSEEDAARIEFQVAVVDGRAAVVEVDAV